MPRISIDAIKIRSKHRKVVPAKLKDLVGSIAMIGLKTPITVQQDGADKFWLVAGRHRLEACRRLGHTTIEVVLIAGRREARMWEIAENLHRVELTGLQRSLLVGHWVKLCAQQMKQDELRHDGAKPHRRGRSSGGRPESGVRAAARKLGVPETTARRAARIATDLKKAAQKEAERLGLENHTLALDRASRHGTVEQQVAYLQEFKAGQIERVRVDAEVKAMLGGTAPPRHAEEAFRQWFRVLGGELKRKVRVWLREMDPVALADELEAHAELAAEDRARLH